MMKMPKRDGTGPPKDSTGPRDGRGEGRGNNDGEGTGRLTGGRKGGCLKEIYGVK